MFGNSRTKYFSSKCTLFRGYLSCQFDSFSLLWLLILFSPRLKQYFVVFTDCHSHLSVMLSCYLPQSVCLGCSCISIPVHLTSLPLASFLASFASFGLFGLTWAFPAGLLLGSDTVVCVGYSVHPYKSLFPGRLEQHSPVSECYCSGPAPLGGVGWCRICI